MHATIFHIMHEICLHETQHAEATSHITYPI